MHAGARGAPFGGTRACTARFWRRVLPTADGLVWLAGTSTAGLVLAADGRFLPPVCVAMHAKVLGRTPIGNLMDPEGAISMPIELRHRHNSELLPTSQRVGIKPELCQPAGEMKLDLNTAL